MKLGCCVEPTYLPHVAECGFDFAELPCRVVLPDATEEKWRAQREALLAHGIPLSGFNILLPAAMHVVGTDVNLHAVHEYLNIVLYRLSELGAKYLSFGSGRSRTVPDGFDRARAEAQITDFLQMLAEKAQAFSIQINLEFLNRKETNLILSLLDAHRLAKQINQPSVKILADLYHIMEQQEPLSDLHQVAEQIGYVHVADTDRKYPGSGVYPYDQFFTVLHDIGYQGPVSVECNWGDTEREMAASAQFLRRFVRTDVAS